MPLWLDENDGVGDDEEDRGVDELDESGEADKTTLSSSICMQYTVWQNCEKMP